MLNIDGYSAIISTVMHMASSFNFEAIAEGIETEVQVQALLKLGVHYFQGYYYSMPIEVEDISTYLNKVSLSLDPLIE
jgi:EAL domain-containing protein (putative c-di-GMP-specific phosphodiesterase class I)